MGSVQPGTSRGTFLQMIGSRKMTPPKMLRMSDSPQIGDKLPSKQQRSNSGQVRRWISAAYVVARIVLLLVSLTIVTDAFFGSGWNLRILIVLGGITFLAAALLWRVHRF